MGRIRKARVATLRDVAQAAASGSDGWFDSYGDGV